MHDLDTGAVMKTRLAIIVTVIASFLVIFTLIITSIGHLLGSIE